MIDIDVARKLQEAGLVWTPADGDLFVIDIGELRDEAFMLSSMVIERGQGRTGVPLFRFNGTTEWALDSVPADKALWLPREDQLRELLGGTFRSLGRSQTGEYAVVIEIPSQPARSFIAEDPAEAYAAALLALVAATR